MSQPVGKIRQPIDIDEFERRLRAPDDDMDAAVDPLSALSRLVDGADAPVAPVQPPVAQAPVARAPVVQPPAAQTMGDWGAAVDQSPPPRAANYSAPAATAPQAHDWEADLRGWEDELRGLAASGPSVPRQPVEPAAPEPAPTWEPARSIEPEMDSFDDYPAHAEPAPVVSIESHAEAAAYMARAASVDYRPGHDPDAPRDLDEYPRGWGADQRAEQVDEEEDYEDEEPARAGVSGRKPLIWMGAVAATLVVLVGGGFALRGGLSGKKDPPTILATAGPAKVQPEATAANNDAAPGNGVFDKGADKVAASKLVSNEEQPVDVSAQAKLPRVVGVNGDNAAKPAPTSAAPAPATTNSYFPEPKRVKTVSVRPDGSVIENDSGARPSAVPTPPLRPTTAPASSATSAATPKPAPPKTTTRVVAPEPAPEAVAKPKPAAPKPVAVATAAKPVAPAAGGGGFSVQFAATSSDTEARDRVAKVQAQYGSALGGHKPSVVRAENNGASIYRVRVGGLSKEGAVAMCTKVKSSGGSCFVAGN